MVSVIHFSHCSLIKKKLQKGPTECQDGVTNNCSQACIQDFLGRYECSCNDGYALHVDACIGEFRGIQIKNIT